MPVYCFEFEWEKGNLNMWENKCLNPIHLGLIKAATSFFQAAPIPVGRQVQALNIYILNVFTNVIGSSELEKCPR